MPVTVHHAGGAETITVNTKAAPAHDGLFYTVGTFDFSADVPAKVVIQNAKTDGYVTIDGIQWLPVVTGK